MSVYWCLSITTLLLSFMPHPSERGSAESIGWISESGTRSVRTSKASWPPMLEAEILSGGVKFPFGRGRRERQTGRRDGC